MLNRIRAVLLVTVTALSLAAAPVPFIDGYDPVAYVQDGRAMKGKSSITAVHDDHTYWFATEAAKRQFTASPETYPIQFEGWCATAVAFNQKVKADPRVFTVQNERIFLFANASAKKTWDADPQGFQAKADANWPAISKR